MGQANGDIIREIVQALLKALTFEASVEVTPEKDQKDTFFCMIRVTTDQNLLIGQSGVNLAAFQHLVRVMLRKKTGASLGVTVDVNGYFSEKRAILEQEAERAAQEALRDNTSVTLRPMLPYERKMVHTFLSLNTKIMTESIGKGDERRVMVRSKPGEGEPLGV